MPKKPLKIIGINPGTRYLGISVFQDSDLRDWRIKVFQEKWSSEKFQKIKKTILSLINDFDPNVLAIKKLHPSRSSKNLKYLVTRIKEFSKRKGLKVYQYSIKDLEEFFIEEDKLNKKNLAEVIVSENPALFHELQKEKCHKNHYYVRVFEAVALGSCCFHQLDK